MDVIEHNRRAWNRQSLAGSRWCEPVDAATIARARAGDWSVILTPTAAVPRVWFGALAGRSVLCLASGGGQQAPLLAAAGASVTSFDLSDEQLAKDALVATRDGLDLRCVRGDMRDLSALADGAFDLVFHPCANGFAPDVGRVWAECFRVLRPGGALLAGFVNPWCYLFDTDDATAPLTVKYALPFADADHPDDPACAARIAGGEALMYSHTLEDQIGGQIAAGFLVAGFYEDGWSDAATPLNAYAKVAIATRALKP
jgi:SAM-dependent methyltransferase